MYFFILYFTINPLYLTLKSFFLYKTIFPSEFTEQDTLSKVSFLQVGQNNLVLSLHNSLQLKHSKINLLALLITMLSIDNKGIPVYKITFY